MSTNAEKVANSGLVLAEILDGIYQFLLSSPKTAVVTLIISGVNGPILICTGFSYNIAIKYF